MRSFGFKDLSESQTLQFSEIQTFVGDTKVLPHLHAGQQHNVVQIFVSCFGCRVTDSYSLEEHSRN